MKRTILREAAQGRLNFETTLEYVDILEEMLKMTQLWLTSYDHLQLLNEKTDVSIVKPNNESNDDLIPLQT